MRTVLEEEEVLEEEDGEVDAELAGDADAEAELADSHSSNSSSNRERESL
jgi:hypothetical protein